MCACDDCCCCRRREFKERVDFSMRWRERLRADPEYHATQVIRHFAWWPIRDPKTKRVFWLRRVLVHQRKDIREVRTRFNYRTPIWCLEWGTVEVTKAARREELCQS